MILSGIRLIYWREAYPAAEGDFSRKRFRGIVPADTAAYGLGGDVICF